MRRSLPRLPRSCSKALTRRLSSRPQLTDPAASRSPRSSSRTRTRTASRRSGPSAATAARRRPAKAALSPRPTSPSRPADVSHLSRNFLFLLAPAALSSSSTSHVSLPSSSAFLRSPFLKLVRPRRHSILIPAKLDTAARSHARIRRLPPSSVPIPHQSIHPPARLSSVAILSTRHPPSSPRPVARPRQPIVSHASVAARHLGQARSLTRPAPLDNPAHDGDLADPQQASAVQASSSPYSCPPRHGRPSPISRLVLLLRSPCCSTRPCPAPSQKPGCRASSPPLPKVRTPLPFIPPSLPSPIPSAISLPPWSVWHTPCLPLVRTLLLLPSSLPPSPSPLSSPRTDARPSPCAPIHAFRPRTPRIERRKRPVLALAPWEAGLARRKGRWALGRRRVADPRASRHVRARARDPRRRRKGARVSPRPARARRLFLHPAARIRLSNSTTCGRGVWHGPRSLAGPRLLPRGGRRRCRPTLDDVCAPCVPATQLQRWGRARSYKKSEVRRPSERAGLRET